MYDLTKIKQLRKAGLTYAKIGENFGISRQRVYQVLSSDKYKAYRKAYRKTDKYKAYHKHHYHKKVGKTFDTCEKCMENILIA